MHGGRLAIKRRKDTARARKRKRERERERETEKERPIILASALTYKRELDTLNNEPRRRD